MGRIYGIVSNFSVPTFESGAIKILQRVFPHTKDAKFAKSNLRLKDVHEIDRAELEIYARKKPFKVSDRDVLEKTMLYLRDSIFSLNKEIKFYEIIENLPNKTSSAFPEYLKKDSKKAIDLCFKRFTDVIMTPNWRDIYDYLQRYPNTLHHRFSTRSLIWERDKVKPFLKVRQILSVPYFIIALEYLVFYNFVESFKASIPYYTVGLTKTQISRKIATLRGMAMVKNKLILCGDISGCDKSISWTHSSLYFQLASNFVLPKHMYLLKGLMAYFIRTPIIYEGGKVYSHGSTVTGSWLTSSFTTISVLISLLYSFYKIYNRFPSYNELLVQGDDFVILIDKEKDSKQFKKYMLEFNLRLRIDIKLISNWTEDIEFLGYIWDFYNKPDQTDDWIISKILYPERYTKLEGPLRIIYRMISIIINLKRYRLLYYKIFESDPILKELVSKRKILEFKLISKDKTTFDIKIPIYKFLRFGWRLT